MRVHIWVGGALKTRLLFSTVSGEFVHLQELKLAQQRVQELSETLQNSQSDFLVLSQAVEEAQAVIEQKSASLQEQQAQMQVTASLSV